MQSEKKRQNEYLKQGYFVDFLPGDRPNECREHQIIQIEGTRVKLQNLSGSTSLVVDINSPKVRAYRTYSRPAENAGSLHHRYNYWSDGLPHCRQQLGKYSDLTRLGELFSASEIVQFLKGRQFFLLISTMEEKYIDEVNLQHLLLYVKQFLGFFIRYWQYLDLGSVGPTLRLYSNSHTALTYSYEQILIGLDVLFKRKSCIGGDHLSPDRKDYIMECQLSWLHSEFLPAIIGKDMAKLSINVIVRVIMLLVRLQRELLIFETTEVFSAYQALFAGADVYVESASSENYPKYEALVKDLLTECVKESAQFNLALLTKMKLYLRYQSIVDQNVNLEESSSKLMKNMAYVLQVAEREGMSDYVKKYLDHQNGLSFYIKRANLATHESYLQKLKNINPLKFVFDAIKWNKLQLLVKTVNKWQMRWAIEAMNYFMYVSYDKTNDKMVMGTELHKIFSRLENIDLSERLLAKLSDNYLEKQSEKMTDVGESEKKTQEENTFQCFKKEMKKLEQNILLLCEELYDSGAKSMRIDYIEKKILMKQLTIGPKTLEAFNCKETNVFKESLVFANLLKQIIQEGQPSDKQQLMPIYHKLCETMKLIKNKIAYDLRIKNIQLVLDYFATDIGTFEGMLCEYVDATKELAVKEFKNRCLDWVLELVQKYVHEKYPERYHQTVRSILNCIKIEKDGQFTIFYRLFKQINEKSIIFAQEYVPTAVVAMPVGLQSFLQAFDSCSNSKFVIKRASTFFTSIHLKIPDEDLRHSLTKEVLGKLLTAVSNNQNVSNADLLPFYMAEVCRLMDSLLDNGHASTEAYLAMIRSLPRLQQIQPDRQIYNVKIAYEDEAKEGERQSICIQAEGSDMLCDVKVKAASGFKLNPYYYNFYVGDEKVCMDRENATVRDIYLSSNRAPPEPKQLVEQSAMKDEHSEEVQAQKREEGHGKQLHVEFRRQEYGVKPCAYSILLRNLRMLFLTFPYSYSIWEKLQVPLTVWSTDPDLIEIKEKILQTEAPFYNGQGGETQTLWSFVMGEPFRKNLILRVLLADPNLYKYKLAWLVQSLSPIVSDIDVQNNMLILELMRKVDAVVSEIEVAFILLVLSNSHKRQETEFLAALHKPDSPFRRLLADSFDYIQCHTPFCLFSAYMRLDLSYYQSTHYNKPFAHRFHKSLINSFKGLLIADAGALAQKIVEYLENCGLQLEYFLKLIKDEYFAPELEPRLQNLLDVAAGYMLVLDTRIVQHENAQTGLTLLFMIGSLLQKITTPPKLNQQRYINILECCLHSRLGIDAMFIIQQLCSFYPELSDRFVQLLRQALDEDEWRKKDTIRQNKYTFRQESGYVGLKNPHSICYMNSLLQQLYHIEPFREGLYAVDWSKHGRSQQDVVYQLKRIFLNLNFRETDSYINELFFEAYKNEDGEPTSMHIQMDVDEFKNTLFDRIENQLFKGEVAQRNFVQRIFGGKMNTIIKSIDCNHESAKNEDFYMICVDVKGMNTLQNALEHFWKPEMLQNDNSWFCETCNKKVVAEKSHHISQYSPYLIFVLKRFQFVHMYKKKINESLSFPLGELKMGQGVNYRLKGIIVHQGAAEMGHYFSIIRLKNKWYEFNDNIVREISEEDVKNQSFGDQSPRWNRNAYVLFYERSTETGMSSEASEEYNRSRSSLQGLGSEIAEIDRQNALVWKAELIFSRDHVLQDFIRLSVKQAQPNSTQLLLEYILCIKSKCDLPTENFIIEMKQLLDLLSSHYTEDLLANQNNIGRLVEFYKCKNARLVSSIKAAVTYILVRNHRQLSENSKVFLSHCLQLIMDQLETSCLFNLMFRWSLKDNSVLRFLVDNRIMGRILEITIPHLILKDFRMRMSQNCPVPYALLDENKIEKKKSFESKELRYHKWRLACLVMEDHYENLHEVERSQLETMNAKQLLFIMQDATTKANTNKICRFTRLLIEKSNKRSYLVKCKQALMYDLLDVGPRYMKLISTILEIQLDEPLRTEIAKQVKQLFRKIIKETYEQRRLVSFDVKWQWILKIAQKHRHFAQVMRDSAAEFKYISSSQDLVIFYSSRNFTQTEGKDKNRYYGLEFEPTYSKQSLLEKKHRMTRQILTQGELPPTEDAPTIDYDRDLTDLPLESIQAETKVMLYEQHGFVEEKIDMVLGDLITIKDRDYDRGDERLMGCYEIRSQAGQGV